MLNKYNLMRKSPKSLFYKGFCKKLDKTPFNVGIVYKVDHPIYKYLSNLLHQRENINVYSIDSDKPKECPDNLHTVFVGPQQSFVLPDVFEKNKTLKWVNCHWAGIDKFLPFKDHFLKNNATLTNAKGAFSDSLGEYAMAAILYFEKNIDKFNISKSKQEWKMYPVEMLNEKTIGIVGYGDIGINIAKKAKLGFDMKVIALKSRLDNLKGKEFTDELVSNDQLAYLLGKSDYVIDVLPSTPKTLNFFDDSKFGLFKKNSIFMNIGRGPTVNEDHLIRHLKSKEIIKAAALDVFKKEPLPANSPFYELDNIIISNHSADFLNDGLENQRNSVHVFLRLLDNYRVTGKLENVIDLELGY